LAPEIERLFGVPQPALHHPEIDTGTHLLMVLDQCAAQGAPLTVRYACLGHDLGKGLTPPEHWPRHIGHEGRGLPLVRRLSERWRVPTECRELALLMAREHSNIHQSGKFDAAARLRLLERCDAWRRPARFEQLLWACECDARGRLGLEQSPYPQRTQLQHDLDATLKLDLGAVSAAAIAAGLSGPAIGQEVHKARLAALQASQAM
jgi:tRNA nucleotidyltransferase (CCA-adding enzyme)